MVVVIASGAILVAVTAVALISVVVIAEAAILAVVTALTAIFDVVIADTAIAVAVTELAVSISATATSISISSFPASSVIVTFEDPALIFLNSRSTPAFCLNTPTPAVPTFDAVFDSPAVGSVHAPPIYACILDVVVLYMTMPFTADNASRSPVVNFGSCI